MGADSKNRVILYLLILKFLEISNMNLSLKNSLEIVEKRKKHNKNKGKGGFMKFIKKWKLLFLLMLMIIMLNSCAALLATVIFGPPVIMTGACLIDKSNCP